MNAMFCFTPPSLLKPKRVVSYWGGQCLVTSLLRELLSLLSQCGWVRAFARWWFINNQLEPVSNLSFYLETFNNYYNFLSKNGIWLLEAILWLLHVSSKPNNSYRVIIFWLNMQIIAFKISAKDKSALKESFVLPSVSTITNEQISKLLFLIE